LNASQALAVIEFGRGGAARRPLLGSLDMPIATERRQIYDSDFPRPLMLQHNQRPALRVVSSSALLWS
jgi:hypothetical protein